MKLMLCHVSPYDVMIRSQKFGIDLKKSIFLYRETGFGEILMALFTFGRL